MAYERQVERADRFTALAYRIAAWTRGTKGLPKLDTLLINKRGLQRRQTAKEQIAMWQVIAARFGGKFRPADKSIVVVP